MKSKQLVVGLLFAAMLSVYFIQFKEAAYFEGLTLVIVLWILFNQLSDGVFEDLE